MNQFQAASQGDLEWFLNNDVDLELTDSRFGSTVLMFASRHGHDDLVSYLISKRPSLVYTKSVRCDKTALMLASRHGHAAVVLLLLGALPDQDKESYINACNEWGDTAINKACGYNHYEVIKILMAAGADPHITDIDGLDAFASSCFAGTKILLDAGATFKPGEDGLSPIGESVKRGWGIDSLKMYLSFYPSVSICESDIKTYTTTNWGQYYWYEEDKYDRAMKALKILRQYVSDMKRTPRTLKYTILKINPKTKSKMLLKHNSPSREMVYI